MYLARGDLMSDIPWILYGATGVTGTLIAEEAIRRGHKPILAGRSPEALALLGKRLGLSWVVVGLDEPVRRQQVAETGGVVLNAAGPFSATAPPLVQACLAAGT